MTNLANGRQRILIHLETKENSRETKDHGRVSYEICQKGIAKAVNLSRARVSQIIREMTQDELIKEDVSHVVGLKRRRKVYSLTPKGFERARKIRKELENEKVILKKGSSEYEIELKKIDTHIDSQNPLLVALNNINDERVIKLTREGKQKKEDIFVGRKDEMSFLLEKLDHVKNDNSLAILIEGDAGIGKTQLVNEFKHKAISAGFEFLMGKGHYDTSEPYLPFKEAFEVYSEKDENKVAPLKLIERGDEEGERIPLKDEEVQKRRRDLIFSQTVKNIRELAKKRSMIIFIDDLQWTDKATLMLFHYLSDNLKDVPILFISALRLQNVSDNDFLDEVLQRMRREDLFDELKLGPLKWKDTKEIAQGLTGEINIPDEFVQLIHDISEGNPLFSKEIIKEMLEEDIIDPQNNKFPTKKGDIELPEVVGDIIEKRIRKLNREDLRILQTGSVIGEEIRFSLLQSVTNIDPFDLLESVDILTETGILEENPEEDRLYFSHGLIRKYVYENIPKSLRKTLHNQVGKSMEKEFEENIEKYYSSIGLHYKKADEFDKGFEFYRKSGEKAESLYAHEDALEMYDEALDLIEKGDLNEKKRWKILERHGDVNKIIGDYDVSLEHYDKIPKDEIKPKYKQRIYRKMASVYARKGEFDKALEAIEKGLAEGEEESIETCKLLSRRGYIIKRQGRYDEAEKDFLTSLDICENFDEYEAYANINQGLGTVYLYFGEYEKSINHLDIALEEFDKINDLHGKSSSLNTLGTVYFKKGDFDKALERYEQSLELREKIGDKRDISSCLNNIGTIYSRKGEFEKAIEYYRKSLELWEEIGYQQGVAIVLINMGDYYYERNELDSALKKLKKSLDISKNINYFVGITTSLANLAKTYLLKGELDEARETYREGLKLCKDTKYEQLVPTLLTGLAEIHIREHEFEKALEKGRKALEISKNIEAKAEEGISHKTLGMVYRKKKEWDEAEEEFEKGKEILEDIKMKRELAKLFFEYALLWKNMGEKKKWRNQIKKSRKMFEDIGMELWIEKCDNELDDRT